ncbi:MAG: hypothetical protein HC896_07425 [Bacteroidales bacterium]|nr:hypothetical protein [Bacteroidales bacterium]
MRCLLFFSMLAFLVSCKKEESGTYIKVTPDSKYSVTAGNVVEYKIEGQSDEGFKSFRIKYGEESDYTKEIFDSTFTNVKYINFFFEYKFPEHPVEEVKAYLKFEAITSSGKIAWQFRHFVIESGLTLQETTGHQFYSSSSNSFNAFNLRTRKALYSMLTDSVDVHLVDASIDSIHGDTLSRTWLSPAGIKFARFNDFDYGNAKYTDLKNAVNASEQKDFISNVKEEDIILVSFDNLQTDSSFAVIKVTEVFDKEGTSLDRYIFNLKQWSPK